MSEKNTPKVTDAATYDAESDVQGTPKSTKNGSKIVLGAGPAPIALIRLHQDGPRRGGNPQLGDKITQKLQKKLSSWVHSPAIDVPCTLTLRFNAFGFFPQYIPLIDKTTTASNTNRCQTAKLNTYMTAQHHTRHRLRNHT